MNEGYNWQENSANLSIEPDLAKKPKLLNTNESPSLSTTRQTVLPGEKIRKSTVASNAAITPTTCHGRATIILNTE
jgi:hypothetical protein